MLESFPMRWERWPAEPAEQPMSRPSGRRPSGHGLLGCPVLPIRRTLLRRPIDDGRRQPKVARPDAPGPLGDAMSFAPSFAIAMCAGSETITPVRSTCGIQVPSEPAPPSRPELFEDRRAVSRLDPHSATPVNFRRAVARGPWPATRAIRRTCRSSFGTRLAPVHRELSTSAVSQP